MAADTELIAVYGAANVDIQGHSAAAFKMGDSNPGHSTITPGGVGRNIAENLARWGASVALVSVFGDDELSPFIQASCTDLGIAIDASLFLSGAISPRYMCLLDADGGLIGAVAAMDALERFGPAELAERFGPGDRAAVVVLDTNLPAATLALAAERWRDKPLLLDTVSLAKAPKALPLLPMLSMIKPNRAEAALLASLAGGPCAAAVPLFGGAYGAAGPLSAGEAPGAPGLREDEARALQSARCLRKAGCAEVFVSLGEGGLLWCGAEGEGIARPLPLPVRNVSGAGDAAAAALACCAAKRYNSESKARFAIAAASLCSSSMGSVHSGADAGNLALHAQGVRIERLS
jgi:pseudouridine kinase